MSTRNRIISALCAMFNEVHCNTSTPTWLLEMHHRSDDDVLAKCMANWCSNYPEQWAKYGIYVM